MNLTRQPLSTFKDVYRFTRGRLSNNAWTRGNTICKQSMSSERIVDTEREVVASNPAVLAPIYLSHQDDELSKLRFAVKNRIETMVRRRFGTTFQVEFFGSIYYGVSHPKSDLDMVVTDSRRPQGFKKVNGLGAIYSTSQLARAISKAGFIKVTHRATASVPIVRFRDPASGLDCDLNVNDRLGLINSTMIKEYCDAHPFLRPLLYRIKEWAKPLSLNSPSPPRGPVSFSSYALALMTISFLQKEGHLPNLQDLPPISQAESKTRIWTRKPHEVWDVRFKTAKDWVPPPLPDFDTLLSSWFSFWKNFPYETETISIRHGGTTSRDSAPQITVSKKKKKKASGAKAIAPISVADPFILTKNVTAAISKDTLARFKTECQNRIIALI